MKIFKILMSAMLISFLFLSCKEETKKKENTTIENAYTTAQSGLRMRSTPSLKGKSVALLPFGTKVIVEKRNDLEVIVGQTTGNLAKIKATGKTGWVFDAYLSETKPMKIEPATTPQEMRGDYTAVSECDIQGLVYPFTGYNIVIEKDAVSTYESTGGDGFDQMPMFVECMVSKVEKKGNKYIYHCDATCPSKNKAKINSKKPYKYSCGIKKLTITKNKGKSYTFIAEMKKASDKKYGTCAKRNQ